MLDICSPTLHRHPSPPRGCEGCGSTAGVEVTHLRTGGSYAICAGCWDRGRHGWYREAKRRRIDALERSEGLR